MSNETKSATTGAHHVGLTVRDLEESTRFFVDDLGYEKSAKFRIIRQHLSRMANS